MIRAAELSLELEFAEDYKEYLAQCGIATADGHEFMGLGRANRLDVIANTITERKKRGGIPIDMYVIERLGIDGIVIWQNHLGEVYQSTGQGEFHKIADSLVKYLG